ncbi:MAG: polyhydroxyalkanoic acid system family protein [Planctomycetaceae bacterium]|nr:polyhydroxyalkanoic acid system family protein [Planctomycetaceae bacterium]
MPQLKVSVDHALDPDEVVKRLRTFLEMVKQAYGHQVTHLEESWGERSGTFSFKALGFKTAGTLEVDQAEVRVVGQIPLAALMFRGKIEETLREQLTRALADEIA